MRFLFVDLVCLHVHCVFNLFHLTNKGNEPSKIRMEKHWRCSRALSQLFHCVRFFVRVPRYIFSSTHFETL